MAFAEDRRLAHTMVPDDYIPVRGDHFEPRSSRMPSPKICRSRSAFTPLISATVPRRARRDTKLLGPASIVSSRSPERR